MEVRLVRQRRFSSVVPRARRNRTQPPFGRHNAEKLDWRDVESFEFLLTLAYDRSVLQDIICYNDVEA